MEWLETQGEGPSRVLLALAQQFAIGGSDALESQRVFETQQVQAAGGIPALRHARQRAPELIKELKRRLLVADREWLL